MATSSQGWPTQEEAAKAARKLRGIGYKARASKTKIRGYYRIIYQI